MINTKSHQKREREQTGQVKLSSVATVTTVHAPVNTPLNRDGSERISDAELFQACLGFVLILASMVVVALYLATYPVVQ